MNALEEKKEGFDDGASESEIDRDISAMACRVVRSRKSKASVMPTM